MVTPVYSHTTLSTGGTIAASTETDKMVKTVLSGAERLHVSDINSTLILIYIIILIDFYIAKTHKTDAP